MAGTRTGTASIWKCARKIERLYSTWGAADLEARTSTAFADCVRAIVACVIAYYATDDLPLQVDWHTPLGPEDVPPPV